MFLNNRLEKYGLYPGNYLRPPVLISNEMVNIKKNLEMEVNLDTDMYIFFLKSARGRFSYISNKLR